MRVTSTLRDLKSNFVEILLRFPPSGLVLLLFLTVSPHIFAEGIININHYSSADGLSDNRITTIIKDREGFVWLASWAGINRFDGNRFTAYKSNPGDYSSLKSNRIDEIKEDLTSSFLWVKAYDNRVYRFDKRKHTFTSLHELIKDEKFKNYQFSRILAVSYGKVWLKTTKDAVVVIDDAGGNHPSFNELSFLNDSSQKMHFFYLDKHEFAWISNERGLFLVKQSPDCSYKITQYAAKHDNPFKIIAEDLEGNMWVSHARGSIIKVDTLFTRKSEINVAEGLIYDIKMSKNGEQLLYTTSAGQLWASDKGGNTQLLSRMPDKSPLYSIYEDSNHGLWIESERYGITKFNPKSGSLIGLYTAKSHNFKPWLRNCTFFEDLNRQVWVSIRGDKISFYDKKKEQLVEFKLNIEGLDRSFSRRVQGVFYDPNGVLWITTENGGLDRIILKGGLFHQNFIQPGHTNALESEVRGIFIDSKDRLWVSTKSGKLSLHSKGIVQQDILGKDFNPTGGIYCITQDNKGLYWLGSKGGGVYLVEEREGQFHIINHFLNSPADNITHRSEVYSILPDKKGRVWVATYGGGLVLLSPQGKSYEVITSENGLKGYPIESYAKLRYLNMDAKGNLWIGSSEGLILFNPDEQNEQRLRFKIYKKEAGNLESLGGNDIQFIYRDYKDEMWVLTSSGGLNRAIGNNPLDTLTFRNYSKKNGFSSDYLLACIEGVDKNLWISTRNGISKFSLVNHKIQNYSYNDGLYETIFSESSVARFKDGRIVFGNVLGYLIFNSEELNTKKEKGNLVFTNFQVNSEDAVPDKGQFFPSDINYLSEVVLGHDQNVVGIEFAMLQSTSAIRQNFVYRLLGYDNVWRNSEGQNKVVYTNLPPGIYTFQVRSQNGELFEGVSSRSLKIEILPPLWKTWWAYIGYALLLALLLLFIKRTAATILSLRQGIAIEKRLAEAKLNFFTQISHELRTPLTLIINPLEEIIHNERLSAKGKSYARIIRDNSRRMVRLVNQVLDLRKVSSGKAVLKMQNVDVVAFVNLILDYFEDYLSGKNIKVAIQSSAPKIIAALDIDKLETVLYNIIANAIKFSPEGGKIHLNIALNKAGDRLLIEIVDEGPGVNDDELNRIFQLYYRGESSAGTEIKGTGIGLALSKELVELHKGQIFAKNATGKGLKVVVELPYQAAEHEQEFAQEPQLMPFAQAQPVFDEEAEGDETTTPDKDKKHILIVEDNPDLRIFLNNKFEGFYQVDVASDGEEGLQKAIATLPDLILSDIMMPKLNGIQMLNKLKNNSVTSHIPVILLTAKNTVESHIESLKYGADYYLPKPLDMRLLLSAVNNILLQRKKFFSNIIEKHAHTGVVEDIKENPIITEFDKEFLEKVIKVVEENIENSDFNIDAIADIIGMSRSGFFKKFKSLTNMAPVDFLRDTRLEKGKELFDKGYVNVSEVAYSVGFNPKYFSTCFKAKNNISPKEYIKKCQGTK